MIRVRWLPIQANFGEMFPDPGQIPQDEAAIGCADGELLFIGTPAHAPHGALFSRKG
jgi:hypothetical protein